MHSDSNTLLNVVVDVYKKMNSYRIAFNMLIIMIVFL